MTNSPKPETGDVAAAEPGERALGRLLQVVGALVVDHQDQDGAACHSIHVRGETSTLVFAAVRVKPEADEQGCQLLVQASTTGFGGTLVRAVH